MKIKKAYTLAEVLIALSIVGVLAAIMVPLANKFQPDPDKAMYLKMYDSLVYTINSLQYGKGAYDFKYKYTDGEGNTKYYDVSHCLFVNTNKAEHGPFKGLGGNPNENKLDQILELAFKSALNKGSITGINVDSYPSNPITSRNFYNIAHITQNGNTYDFCITANGNVIAMDPKGQAYIASRSNWKSGTTKESDFQQINVDNINTAISFEVLPNEEPEEAAQQRIPEEAAQPVAAAQQRIPVAAYAPPRSFSMPEVGDDDNFEQLP